MSFSESIENWGFTGISEREWDEGRVPTRVGLITLFKVVDCLFKQGGILCNRYKKLYTFLITQMEAVDTSDWELFPLVVPFLGW